MSEYSRYCKEAPALAPAAVYEFHASLPDSDRVWSEERYEALLAAIDGMSADGLNPEHYRLKELRRHADDPEDRECLATDAWLSAAAHMVHGKLDPVSLEPDWTAARRSVDLAAVLKAALRSATIGESLSSLAPRQPEYAALKAELRALQKLGQTELAEVEPPDPEAKRRKKRRKAEKKAAERREKVRVLQTWLTALDVTGPLEISGEYDETLRQTLVQFQKEAGLPADGVLDDATIGALERIRRSRLDRIRVNLERWRWLPDDLGPRHVRANIAGFDVTTFENGQVVRTYAAIVGRLYRRTPVFSDTIAYIVLNPWWETPAKLARTDQLTLFSHDPAAPKRMGFQVLDAGGKLVDPDSIEWNRLSATTFPYRLRQAPGLQNPLGQVKIMFPNVHSVYLHDTPVRGLFAERQRAFSSGCIRVQYPIDLVEWLLNETEGWDRRKIDTVLASGSETRVNLAGKVPVHILYQTATVEAGSRIRYLDDIYDRDGWVLDGLEQRVDEISQQPDSQDQQGRG